MFLTELAYGLGYSCPKLIACVIIYWIILMILIDMALFVSTHLKKKGHGLYGV